MLKRTWNDPVWSKVIGGLITPAIIALLVILWDVIKGPGSKIWGNGIPTWLIIILSSAALFISIIALFQVQSGRGHFRPQLQFAGVNTPDLTPDKPQHLPLKSTWTFRNDSAGPIQVSLVDYVPRNVKIKQLAIAVLQAQFHQEWLPKEHGMGEIAVLPGQLLRGWIAPDETKYTPAQVRDQVGSMGKLVMKVNGEKLNFDL